MKKQSKLEQALRVLGQKKKTKGVSGGNGGNDIRGTLRGGGGNNGVLSIEQLDQPLERMITHLYTHGMYISL